MPWLNSIISAITGKTVDIESIKKRLQTPNPNNPITDAELKDYINDIDSRVRKVTRDLRAMYGMYGVTFTGFKSLDQACELLHESIKNNKDVAYNNLIKLESAITTEQKRHLSLIRLAVTTQGAKVIDQINKDPNSKATFENIFSGCDAAGKENGVYQQLWSEIHKLSEYIITQKNKVYH